MHSGSTGDAESPPRSRGCDQDVWQAGGARAGGGECVSRTRATRGAVVRRTTRVPERTSGVSDGVVAAGASASCVTGGVVDRHEQTRTGESAARPAGVGERVRCCNPVVADAVPQQPRSREASGAASCGQAHDDAVAQQGAPVAPMTSAAIAAQEAIDPASRPAPRWIVRIVIGGMSSRGKRLF